MATREELLRQDAEDGYGLKFAGPVIFSLPPNELVLWTMLALAVVLVAYWLGSARARFRGPGSGLHLPH
jgi:hypothetical protein